MLVLNDPLFNNPEVFSVFRSLWSKRIPLGLVLVAFAVLLAVGAIWSLSGPSRPALPPTSQTLNVTLTYARDVTAVFDKPVLTIDGPSAEVEIKFSASSGDADSRLVIEQTHAYAPESHPDLPVVEWDDASLLRMFASTIHADVAARLVPGVYAIRYANYYGSCLGTFQVVQVGQPKPAALTNLQACTK